MKIGNLRLGRLFVSVAVIYALSVALLVPLAWALDIESWMPTWVGFVVGAVLGGGVFRLTMPLLRPWYTEPPSPDRPEWTEDRL